MQFGRSHDPAAIVKLLLRFARPDRLNETDVFSSPGLNGDGAFEFVETFAGEFDVDMADYLWRLYHHDETEMMLPQWLAQAVHRVNGNRPDPTRVFLPVSVQHLFEVASRGRWFDPAVRPCRRPWPAFWRTAVEWLDVLPKDVRRH